MQTDSEAGGTQISAYGIAEKTASGDLVDAWAEQIRTVGFVVIDSGFSDTEIQDFSDRLDRVTEQQADEFGSEKLELIGDGLTARAPLVYDDTFLALAAHPTVLMLTRALIGDYVVLMQQNGVINPSNQPHAQAAYHRDLPYQHFVSSRPLSVSALFCIDPFRAESGATTVIPASHHVEAFPSDQAAIAMEIPIEAERGSFIVFDSMLFHKAGQNVSDLPRRAVNQMYTIPLITQQISLPDALHGRHAEDPVMAQLLGYLTSPPRSVDEWRKRRLSRFVY